MSGADPSTERAGSGVPHTSATGGREHKRTEGRDRRRRTLRILLPALVIAAALAVAALIVTTADDPEPEPRAEREVLVRTVVAARQPHRLDVTGRGIVTAAQRVVLSPQVSGRIDEVNPRLAPGSFMAEGELLVRLEEDDFRLAVREAESALTDARAELELEEGRRQVAEEEWQLFEDQLDDLLGEEEAPAERSPLALRLPQIEAARGRVQAAEAQLERAQLELSRTRIYAPFDAIVLREDASVGRAVGPQAEIIELVGAERLWIEAAVRLEEIDFIAIPDINAARGSEVLVRQHVGAETLEWTGRVVRLLGDLAPQGLMARVLVEVEDPFGRNPRDEAARWAPLLLNASVHLDFAGRRVEHLVEVPRAALREGDRVFVADRGARLAVREADIVWRLPESVLVRAGVEDGERVVVSPVPTPVEGLRLRLEDGDDEPR